MLGGSVKAENGGVGFYHSVRWAARSETLFFLQEGAQGYQ